VIDISTSTLPAKLISDSVYPDRKFYLDEITIADIKEDTSYLVRDLDENHKNDLKNKIRDQGLIEPITVNREHNGSFVLLAGQHRLAALRELKVKTVAAKVYVDLEETAKRLIGYMSNESRKRPSAGKRYEALNEIFDETLHQMHKESGIMPSEEDVANKFYFSSKAMPVKELIVGIHVDKLRNDTNSLVNRYDLIQNAQVPRKKIVEEIQKGRLPLMTAQNTFAALMQLCRSKPVTQEEEEQGLNYRKNEYANVKEFFDRVITEFIQPWIKVGQIESVINFCRRYPFEAFARIVHDLLVEDGLPSASTRAAPFFHDRKIDWDRLFNKIALLKDIALWQDPRIEQERNITDLKSRLRYYIENSGKLPNY